jgi:hypothetical protein
VNVAVEVLLVYKLIAFGPTVTTAPEIEAYELDPEVNVIAGSSATVAPTGVEAKLAVTVIESNVPPARNACVTVIEAVEPTLRLDVVADIESVSACK